MVYKITYGLHILNLALTYVVVAITQKMERIRYVIFNSLYKIYVSYDQYNMQSFDMTKNRMIKIAKCNKITK